MSKSLSIVVQGNVRNGTKKCIQAFVAMGYFVILSCWEDCNVEDVEKSNNILILRNKYPGNRGLSNRNLMRLSAANGIEHALMLGYAYTLKWRSDMIPTISLFKYIEDWGWRHYADNNKIITPNYRCIKFYPRIYSTINDMVHLGRTKELLQLWDIKNMSLNKPFNGPKMLELWPINQVKSMYCSEAELLALYISKKIGCTICDLIGVETMDYDTFFTNHIELADYKKFGIRWLDEKSGRRALIQNKDRGVLSSLMFKEAMPLTSYSRLNLVDRLHIRARRTKQELGL